MPRYAPLAAVAAAAAYAAPAVLLASDVALVMFISTPGLILQRTAMTLFVPALGGIATLARDRARWQVGAGAGLAIIGAAAIALRPETLVVPARLPAVLFPLGLIVMAAAMIGSPVSRRVAALMGAGAILFPFAHVSGLPAALIGGDIMFLAAFWMLAPRMANPKSQTPNPKSQSAGS
jgi:hypothetical protein